VSLGTETVRPQTVPAETPSATSDEAVWRARPLAAQAIRALVLVVPTIVSVGAVLALHRAMPPERSWEGFAIMVAADVVVILFVASIVHRILQRLLPLATLLSLSLVFPDRSPRRFKIVLRANSSARMRTRLLEARNEDTDVSTALEDLLTYLAALARHDRMTRGHCERVRAFVDLLAVEMALSQADRDRLRWAALLHDIGKLRVPAKILRKPGKPTDDEWETLKRHPVDGEKLVRPLAPWLGAWTMAVEQHHERFGGGGYPRGLVGTEISLGGRIVAVADAYEVMITSRPYKRPVKPECARQELVRYSGDQFDPTVVRAFLGISIGNLRKAMGCIGLLGEVPILATAPRAGALLQEAGRHTLGVVGTAAGTGAIVAATALSPVYSPAASPPVPQGAAHATAKTTISDGRRGPIESSRPSPSSTPARSGEGSTAGSPSADVTGSSTGTSAITQSVSNIRTALPVDDPSATTVKLVTSVVAAPQGSVPDAAAVQNALGPQGDEATVEPTTEAAEPIAGSSAQDAASAAGALGTNGG
jgi:hypothetical protein